MLRQSRWTSSTLPFLLFRRCKLRMLMSFIIAVLQYIKIESFQRNLWMYCILAPYISVPMDSHRNTSLNDILNWDSILSFCIVYILMLLLILLLIYLKHLSIQIYVFFIFFFVMYLIILHTYTIRIAHLIYQWLMARY